MSMELHIVRVPEVAENKITREEWLSCIEADQDLQRKEGDDIPQTWIVAVVAGAEPWEALRWSGASISASYPQTVMMSKMMDLAERLSAVVMSDDGIIFKRNENGKIVCEEF